MNLDPTELAAIEATRNGGPKPRFVPKQLADHLSAETPVAVGGGGLYVYENGHYRPNGRQNIRDRITRKLGDDWKRSRADEVIAYLFDSAPRLWDEPPTDRINCANGILNIYTGELERHDPAFLSPAQIPVRYDPKATCPAIDEFLVEVLDDELAVVIHELAGYIVTPDNSLQKAVMMLGEGANGKSTLLRVLTELVGTANASAIALHRLDEDRFAPAELYGKYVNVFADLDARALQASSIFKSITGGDAITGERKYADPFAFRPYARLIFSANEPPPTPDSSDAFFRRWVVIPFERKFEGKEADRKLIDKLTTPQELSGLLNHGLAALPSLRRQGAFTETEATMRARERFRVDSDSVAGFLADQCLLNPDGRTPKPKLYPAYRLWCEQNNRRPLSKQRFNRRVEASCPSVYVGTVQGTEHWQGLELRNRGEA